MCIINNQLPPKKEEIKNIYHEIEKDLFDDLDKAKLSVLRQLYKDTIANGKTQWNNRTILSWIDKQKLIIGGDINNEKIKQ